MTLEEFSNEFDIMILMAVNQLDYPIPIHIPVAFDEYEKSVFLTNAQNDLVLSYYNGRNESGISFESTEEVRRYLDELVITTNPTLVTPTPSDALTPKSKMYSKPTDLWFITYEQGKLTGDCSNTIIPVIPVTLDEFYNTYNNPFRRTNRAIRLDPGNGYLEVICDKQITYTIRYIKKLSPIILADLGDLSIAGESSATECQLNDALHRDILRVAVSMALQTILPKNQRDNKEKS